MSTTTTQSLSGSARALRSFDFASAYTTWFVRPESRMSVEVDSIVREGHATVYVAELSIDANRIALHTEDPVALAAKFRALAAALEDQFGDCPLCGKPAGAADAWPHTECMDREAAIADLWPEFVS
jgi:hypothetical protein